MTAVLLTLQTAAEAVLYGALVALASAVWGAVAVGAVVAWLLTRLARRVGRRG